MRNCFILFSVSAATAVLLSAGAVSNAITVTLVVRTDARTGRLVRSVARAGLLKPESSAPQIELPPAPAEIPEAFARLVDEIAERHAVDRDLVHSMISVESNYNPLAVSTKGALGLMQLVPSTARRFGVADAFNPAQNVEGGVRYLKYLLDHYNGDHRLALAAYNSGEGTVERFGGIPPFAETRSYVSRVGKALNAKKDAKKQQEANPPAKADEDFNTIRAFVNAVGRICYRTP
jgi:soluble lytic murein transglycosylase-like protein